MWRLKFSLLLLFLSLFSSSSFAEGGTLKIRQILRLEISSSINPATYDYLASGLKKASAQGMDLLLIRLNTPGGLVSTTKDILTLFGESEIPVAIWIGPEGASATSAGAIIASGAHILVMSPGTNIGAATPVQMGKDAGKDVRKKAINDLVALVQSLSEARGRDARGFGEMISSGKSFKASEARKKKLVDALVNSPDEFLSHLQGRKIVLRGNSLQLEAKGATFVKHAMDLGQGLLNIFANPSLAYILFLLGAALLYLELKAPGGFIAGSIGAICLLLAGIGLQVLPLNFGALGLVVLSFALFVMEAYITSYGILSLAGMGALITGSLFLFRTENSYLELSSALIFSAAGAIGLFLLLIAWIMIRTHKEIGGTRFNELVGKRARIVALLRDREGDFLYQVKVGGELWSARSGRRYQVGEDCQVLEQEREDMLLVLP